MLYSEMLQSDISETDMRKRLAGGDQIAITVRIPKNLRDAAKEAAELHGVSFSGFLRMCMIEELTRKSGDRSDREAR